MTETATAPRTFGAPPAPAPALPDLDDELAVGPATTDEDDLRAELTADVAGVTEPLTVPSRPRYSVSFRTDFAQADLDAYRRKARDKRFADNIDGVKFAALLLGATGAVIYRDGVPLELDGVSPVNFQTRELRDLYTPRGAREVATVSETVRKFYAMEGHVDATARRVMVLAGWGDDVDAAGPTD